jgi:hypothetical protein
MAGLTLPPLRGDNQALQGTNRALSGDNGSMPLVLAGSLLNENWALPSEKQGEEEPAIFACHGLWVLDNGHDFL